MPKNPNISDEDLDLYQKLLYEKQTQENNKLISPQMASPYKVQNPENAAAKQEPGLIEANDYSPIELAVGGLANPLMRGASKLAGAGEEAIASKLEALKRIKGQVGEYRPPSNMGPVFEGGQLASEQKVPLEDVVESMADKRDVMEKFRKAAIKEYKDARDIPEYLLNPELSPPSYHPDILPEVSTVDVTKKVAMNPRTEKMMKDYYTTS